MLRHLHPLINAPLISAGRRALPRRRPDNLTLLLVALGILGAALVLARQVNYGVGLNWDSGNYIFVVRSLLAGDGFIQFDGDFYHAWPPLYPLLLAGAGFGIFDPLTVAGPLNAALFGLTVFSAGMYLRARLASRLLTLWGCLILTLAWPLLHIASFALSEMSFILFSILALMNAERLLSRGGNSALLWAGVFTALACLSRYMAITLVLAVVPLLALQPGVALPEKSRRIVIYGLVALAPVGLWTLRNLVLIGSLTGNRDWISEFTLTNTIYWNLSFVARYLLNPLTGYFELPLAYALLGIWIALLAIVFVSAARAYLKAAASAVQVAQLLLIGFAAVYAIVVIGVTAEHFTHAPQLRHMVPSYLPLLLATLLALDPALRYARQFRWCWRQGRAPALAASASVLLLGSLLLWTAWQLPVNVQAIYHANTRPDVPPEGYSADILADSAARRYLRAEITDSVVFTHLPLQAYAYVGGSNRYDYLYCGDYGNLRTRAEAAGSAVYLLWIYGSIDYLTWLYGEICSPEDDGGLEQRLTALPLEPVAAFADGVLLRYRRTTDAVDADADARRDLRQHYADIADSVPTAASATGFKVYLDDPRQPQWITYINDQCAPDDTQALFHLHVVPVNSIYLTATERQIGYGAYGFKFDADGVRIDGQCMVSARLPDYPIASISTGQVVPGESVIWEVEYEPGRSEQLLAELAQARQTQSPIIQADFEVYHNDGRLIYAKEPCTPADTAAAFFLHITPTDAADLPAGNQHGFDDRAFNFYQAGALIAGQQCIASAALPDYAIAGIHTGQVIHGAGVIWELEYEPGRAERLRAELAAVRQARLPVIQADFAVYHNDGRLIYAKQPCTPADTTAPFFLHLVPTAAADLPASSRQHGFDNRDFPFEQAGILSDGQCIASVALPDYDIAIIRTGQYTPGAGRLWETEFAPAAP